MACQLLVYSWEGLGPKVSLLSFSPAFSTPPPPRVYFLPLSPVPPDSCLAQPLAECALKISPQQPKHLGAPPGACARSRMCDLGLGTHSAPLAHGQPLPDTHAEPEPQLPPDFSVFLQQLDHTCKPLHPRRPLPGLPPASHASVSKYQIPPWQVGESDTQEDTTTHSALGGGGSTVPEEDPHAAWG